MMASQTELLIHGFIREQERKLSLLMNIPAGIILFIINYFPVLYRFGLHDERMFDVSDDRLSIRSKGDTCDGYMIYADLEDKRDVGLNEGVHIWSLLSRIEPFCFRSIGITTIKADVTQFVDRFIGDAEGYHYYYDGANDDPVWGENMIFSVKLDCNNWKVFFYNDDKLLKSQDIEPDQNYFLAVPCCAMAWEVIQGISHATSLQCVESPNSI